MINGYIAIIKSVEQNVLDRYHTVKHEKYHEQLKEELEILRTFKEKGYPSDMYDLHIISMLLIKVDHHELF